MLDDIQIVYAEKLHILIYVKFPLRKLLLPDGALILPVIPDRIILVKDNKQLYLSIKQLQFNKEIMRQSYEIKRKAVIFFEKGGNR